MKIGLTQRYNSNKTQMTKSQAVSAGNIDICSFKAKTSWLDDIPTHRQALCCANAAYNRPIADIPLPTGFSEITNFDFQNGKIFQNGKNDIYIAWAGTQEFTDLPRTVQIFTGSKPAELDKAVKLYESVQKEYPNRRIILTGHSAGGTLAQYVASQKSEANAVTFAPVGIGSINKQNALTLNDSITNIVNYKMKTDPIVDNLFINVGKTYLLDGQGHSLTHFQNADFSSRELLPKVTQASITPFEVLREEIGQLKKNLFEGVTLDSIGTEIKADLLNLGKWFGKFKK